MRISDWSADGCSSDLLANVGLEVHADHVRPRAGAGRDGDVVALVDALQDVGDLLAHRFRRDAVGGVVGLLLLAPPVGLLDRGLERLRHHVGVEDDPAVEVARGAARSEEHTSELQSLMRISYAVFCLKKKTS